MPKFDLMSAPVRVHLMKMGITPEEFLGAAKFYSKKGIQKRPEEIIASLKQAKNVGTQDMLRQQQMAQKPMPGAQQVVAPPQKMMDPQAQRMMNVQSQRMTRPQEKELTQENIKETIKEAILIYEKKKYINKVVAEQITEQKRVYKNIEYILTEGPLSNVWGGLKAAGGALGQTGKQLAGQLGQAFDTGRIEAQQQQQIKAAQQELNKALKQVATAKQKYNQEILKSAEILNVYHDSVINLYKIFQQVSSVLGPSAHQIEKSVSDAVGQLHYDLSSEKGQIDSFLQTLSRQLPDVGTQGKEAERKAKEAREAEAGEYGRSSMGRDKAMSRPSGTAYPQEQKTEDKKTKKDEKKDKKK